MYSKEIQIVNPTGIHARPASQVVAQAAKYESDITLKRLGVDADGKPFVDEEEDEYDAKSIISLLVLGLQKGEWALIAADGPDEQKAVDEMCELISSLDE